MNRALAATLSALALAALAGAPASRRVAAGDVKKPAGSPTPIGSGETHISVVVDPETGETRFQVQEGTVEVSAGGSTAFAKPGEAVRTGGGATPRVMTANLTAPSAVEPANGQTLRAVDGHLRWTKVDGADRFTVTVARDALFRDRVATVETAGTSATLTNGLADGLYHWRVVATAANGVEGPASMPLTFRLDNRPSAAVAVATIAEKPRLYWLRDHRCDATMPHCGAWVAVDTETGIEREIHLVDLKTLKLDAAQEKDTREKLVKGLLAVRGTFRNERGDGVTLVVADVLGRR